MKPLLFAVLAAVAVSTLAACAKDPYQDPMYVLQRNLRNRNNSWGAFQDRQRMRREARDDRYQDWFNNVME